MNSFFFFPLGSRLSSSPPKDGTNADQTTTPEGGSTSNGPAADHAPNPELAASSLKASSPDAVLNMLKDVDGMISRLPAARGSDGPTDGDLSALEEEVREKKYFADEVQSTTYYYVYWYFCFLLPRCFSTPENLELVTTNSILAPR